MAEVSQQLYQIQVTAKVTLLGSGLGGMSVPNGPILQFSSNSVVGNSSNPAASDFNSAVAAASSAAAALMVASPSLGIIQAWNSGGM